MRTNDTSLIPANKNLPLIGGMTMTLNNERRSKLNKDKVKPYDYTNQNSLYEIFKGPSLEYLYQLERAKEVRKTMWRKPFVRTKPNIAKNMPFYPFLNPLVKLDKFITNDKQLHSYLEQFGQEMHDDLEYVKSLEKEVDELESEKADFSNIYDLLLEEQMKTTQFAKKMLQLYFEKNVKQYKEIQNLKAQCQTKNKAITTAQNKDAKSHKTTKRYMPVEKSSASKKPERQIPTGHRFSNKKTTTVPEKTMNPRSCLRWQLTGRIFKTVGLSAIEIVFTKDEISSYDYLTHNSFRTSHRTTTNRCLLKITLQAPFHQVPNKTLIEQNKPSGLHGNDVCFTSVQASFLSNDFLIITVQKLEIQDHGADEPSVQASSKVVSLKQTRQLLHDKRFWRITITLFNKLVHRTVNLESEKLPSSRPSDNDGEYVILDEEVSGALIIVGNKEKSIPE
ncbi:hypothetical protein Tco_0412515 [Tanacetum coccineum]